MSAAKDVPALLAPISPAAPAGCDVRGEPAWEVLRAEIDKLDDPRAASADWARVEECAAGLLCAHGKDVTVACYFAWARFERAGSAGLTAGLGVLAGLLTHFGEAVWPARLRARVQALAWLHEHLERQLTGARAPRDSEREALRAQLVGVHAASVALLGANVPRFDGLAARLAAPAPQHALASAPSAEIDPSASARSGTPRRAALKPVDEDAASEEALVTPLQRGRGLLRAAHRLTELARGFREADPTDPRGYRLLRVAGGLRFEVAPPAGRGGRTELDPPSARGRAELAKAMKEGAWAEVVALSEGLLSQRPLWLDAHWLTARALGELGPPYTEAHAVVVREASLLIARLPALAELAFADGTPLGSRDAIGWLRARSGGAAQASASADSTPEPAAPRAGEGDLGQLITEVVARVPQADAAFERALRVHAGRTAFRLRLALAQQLERAGRTECAARVYAGLARELDVHRLERWEPGLAREVALGRYRTLPALARTGAVHPDEARIVARVARLAPTALLERTTPRGDRRA